MRCPKTVTLPDLIAPLIFALYRPYTAHVGVVRLTYLW